MNRQLPIESHFVSKLASYLNAEIVLGTVRNFEEACNWIRHTYMYFCMLRRPTLYGLSPEVAKADITLAERRANLVYSAASVLEENNLVNYVKESGYFQVTDLGRIASHYDISPTTISTYYKNFKREMGTEDLFHLFCLAEEFQHVTVRPNEEVELDHLSAHIRIKESMENHRAKKISILLQAYILRLKFEGHMLNCDMVYIAQSAGRLMRALFEIIIFKQG